MRPDLIQAHSRKMRNIKLTIEYDGTNYSGWQVQNSRAKGKRQRPTIQQALEQALKQILQQRIKLIASGRTDAGVHAQAQVANFKTRSKLDCQKVQTALNSVLPYDIRIRRAEEAGLDFHARFSARSKLYRYSIVNDFFVSPQMHHFCHLVKYRLNVNKMRKGALDLLGRHNFRSFQSADKSGRAAVRTIKRLDIRRHKNCIYVDIEADGFLYRMVRNIVGTLLEVGRGRIEPVKIKQILQAKNRIYAGPCSPAKGLCLIQVAYKK